MIAPKPVAPPPSGEACGSVVCKPGLVCCNASCGTCIEPGGACSLQYCAPPTPPAPPSPPSGGDCTTDKDCQAYSNYCGGCSCVPLAQGEELACIPENVVRCIADPCLNQKALCQAGKCTLVSK